MFAKQIKYIEREVKTEIDIFVEKSPKSIFIFFVTVSAILALMPFVVLIIALIEKDNLGFGFIFSIIIAGLVDFYLLRLAFWNRYGIEKFIIENNSIIYIADYKIFKDKIMQLEGEKIIVGYYDKKIDNENKTTAKLIFEYQNQQIRSIIDLPFNEIENLICIIERKLF